MTAALALLLSTTLTACAGHVIYPSGPFHGKVVDAETNQPLAGAAVVAVWYWEAPGPGHRAERLYDAREVVTDANGEFTLPRTIHVPVWGAIREPEIVIYYPGYRDYLGGGDFLEVRDSGSGPKTVELVRLKASERRLHARIPTSAGGVPEASIPNLARLVEMERKALGLDR